MTKLIRIDESLSAAGGYFLNADRLIESGHSEFQAYEVYDTTRFGTLFRLDGCFMTSERDEFFYHENMIHVPLLAAHPARRALIIGGGDGGSAEELCKYRSMTQIVLVELDGKVIDIARRYFESIHHGKLDDPRVEIRIEDGLRYVRDIAPALNQPFDFIVLDLTDPVGPAAELYTARFFADCKRLLTDGGALSLHIGSPIFKPENVRQILANLRSVFSIVTPYFVNVPLYGTLWGMACASDTVNPRTMTADAVEARIQKESLLDLQFLNGDAYASLMALPNYLRKLTDTTGMTAR